MRAFNLVGLICGRLERNLEAFRQVGTPIFQHLEWWSNLFDKILIARAFVVRRNLISC